MRATQLLKKDHKTVEELFKEFEDKGERAYKAKQTLFERIQRELEQHAQLEEEIFYPAVKQIGSKKSQALIDEATEEHDKVKTLLTEISELEPEDEQFDVQVKELIENVRHHVEEEEGEMFPHVEQHLSEERLEELGERMEARKTSLKKELKARAAS